jgi:hypothetical protein
VARSVFLLSETALIREQTFTRGCPDSTLRCKVSDQSMHCIGLSAAQPSPVNVCSLCVRN